MMKKFFLFFCIVLIDSLSISAVDNKTIKLTWPDDFENPQKYNGQIIELNQKLYITNISNWYKYGSITVARERLMSPTDIAIPSSDEYYDILKNNHSEELIIDDGLDVTFPQKLPWIDQDGYIRTGAYINNITGKFNIEKYGYVIVPTTELKIEGNTRPSVLTGLGEHNLRICSFNLRIYLASDFGTGFGPNTKEEAEIQHKKIVKALLAIDADVYGLLEIQQGQNALQKLVNSLNEENPNAKYDFINDGTSENGSYVKSGFIYRKDKVTPIRQVQSNDTGVKHRKKAQCFKKNDDGEKFIMIINHFKSKSGKGSGENADKNDGQGAYNADRVKEATSVITFAKSCMKYYDDKDVIVMGDLNAYSMEDPIRIFTNEGYTNLIKKYGGEQSYTFSFRGTSGCLDHALANKEILTQVSGCSVFHINSDESFIFSYDGSVHNEDMYRSSDHDPVVVGLNLGNKTDIDNTFEEKDNNRIIYAANGIIGIASAKGNKMDLFSITGTLMKSIEIYDNDCVFANEELGIKNGIYIIRLTDENGDIHTEKLIISK